MPFRTPVSATFYRKIWPITKKILLKPSYEGACYLLKSTNLSISEISVKTGFEDANYFSRQFKKHTGLTPKEYRKLETF
ncbi:AraC family transcriptional regulator [Eubacterium callanderi]|nr:AraC family transcriptional regulator [Eubacterium callanderi]